MELDLDILSEALPQYTREELEKLQTASREEIAQILAGKLEKAVDDAYNVLLKTPTWKCGCGTESSGRYCPSCGANRVWFCKCGTANANNFCTDCGSPRS